jgi:hypothetical protein
MKCERCQGLLVQDHFMDMRDLSEGMWVATARCMNCGHAVDPVMVANRRRHANLLARREETVRAMVHDAVTPLLA